MPGDDPVTAVATAAKPTQQGSRRSHSANRGRPNSRSSSPAKRTRSGSAGRWQKVRGKQRSGSVGQDSGNGSSSRNARRRAQRRRKMLAAEGEATKAQEAPNAAPATASPQQGAPAPEAGGATPKSRRRNRNRGRRGPNTTMSIHSVSSSSNSATAPPSAQASPTAVPAVPVPPQPTVTLLPHVRCTDGSNMESKTLHEIIKAEHDPFSLEDDTPVAGPARPPLAPPMMDLGPSASHNNPKLSPALRACTPVLPPHVFTAEGIATPNTFFRMPAPASPPPLSTADNLFRDLLNDYDPAADQFDWHQSEEKRAAFADRVLAMCDTAKERWQTQSLFPTLPAPAYVLGDIHGNFSDLRFFLRSFLVMDDITMTPAQLLCLGDYVDRGPYSLECSVLLIALALEAPEKVVLLRGNHEDRVVCGDQRTYGNDCFLAQCGGRLGVELGRKVFRAITRAFKYLPLACELKLPNSSTKILATHGGFPRFTGDPTLVNKMERLRDPDFPRFLTLFPNNPMAQDDSGTDVEFPEWVEEAWFTAFDLMWSDPTTPDGDAKVDNDGFGCNSRGMNVLSFSDKAVEAFLTGYGYAMLFRAHQEKQYGLRVSKSSKVLTLFSSSNYLGHGNGAGCAVVNANGDVQLVMKT